MHPFGELLMNADPPPTFSDMFPQFKRFKFRTTKIGTKPVSPLYPVAIDGDKGAANAPRPHFKIDWQNEPLGITVHLHEREDGHVIADAHCTYADLLDTSAVSVGLYGSHGEHAIRKSVLLNVHESGGRRGSADFGLLTDLVKELGPELGVIAFLLV